MTLKDSIERIRLDKKVMRDSVEEIMDLCRDKQYTDVEIAWKLEDFITAVIEEIENSVPNTLTCACDGCDNEIEIPKKGRINKYCSKQCKNNDWWRKNRGKDSKIEEEDTIMEKVIEEPIVKKNPVVVGEALGKQVESLNIKIEEKSEEEIIEVNPEAEIQDSSETCDGCGFIKGTGPDCEECMSKEEPTVEPEEPKDDPLKDVKVVPTGAKMCARAGCDNVFKAKQARRIYCSESCRAQKHKVKGGALEVLKNNSKDVKQEIDKPTLHRGALIHQGMIDGIVAKFYKDGLNMVVYVNKERWGTFKYTSQAQIKTDIGKHMITIEKEIKGKA